MAQFIGHTTVVENYDRLKGFDRIENADKAVIRPEFIKISKSGNLDRYQSAAEEGIVTDVVFRGNRMDITVSINGIEVVGERSLEKDPIAVGEKVHVLIYRLYIFDEEKTYRWKTARCRSRMYSTFRYKNSLKLVIERGSRGRYMKIENKKSYTRTSS